MGNVDPAVAEIEEAMNVALPTGSKRILWGASIFTTVWLVGAIYIATKSFCWAQAPTALNEWGDFVAGVSAPIAFIWLVVAVLLQSTELREQRKELALTRSEFASNRAVMDKQAAFIKTQTDIMSDDHNSAEANDIFVASVELIAMRIRQYANGLAIRGPSRVHPNGVEYGFTLNMRTKDYESESDKLVIAKTVKFLRSHVRNLRDNLSDEQLTADYPYDFQRLHNAVSSSAHRLERLPVSFRLKSRTLEIPELQKQLDALAVQIVNLPSIREHE